MAAAVNKHRRPPGPRGSLLLGSAPAIARDPLAAYSAMAREYGDIVRIRFVFWSTYLLFHSDHVRHVLQEKHTNYSKDLYTYRMLRPVVGNGLVTNDGADWLRQRRLIQPAFHRQRLARVGGVAVATCEEMLERWSTFAREGRPVDVSAEMLRINTAGRRSSSYQYRPERRRHLLMVRGSSKSPSSPIRVSRARLRNHTAATRNGVVKYSAVQVMKAICA